MRNRLFFAFVAFFVITGSALAGSMPNPVVTITTPTSSGTYETTEQILSIAGTASPSDGQTLVRVDWMRTSNGGGSGICTGTESWSVEGIVLVPGDNLITVTATDSAGLTGSAQITVRLNLGVIPTVSIAWPTSEDTYNTVAQTLNISGYACPSLGETVTGVAWSNSRGGSGACTNSIWSGFSIWRAEGIVLEPGENVITITATDSAMQEGSSILTVTKNPYPANWTVTIIHPAEVDYSTASDASGGQQAGYTIDDGIIHACLWNGTAESYLDLHPAGFDGSCASGLSGGQQVGYVKGTATGGKNHAFLWNSSPDDCVELNPSGWDESQSYDTWNNRQVGRARGAATGGNYHACMWNGTAESFFDLNPSGYDSSAAGDIWGDYQVGNIRGTATGEQMHASLWHSTPESFVDLNPLGFDRSSAAGISNGQQAGYSMGVATTGQNHACLWSGTEESYVDLHPAVWTSSNARGISNGVQVGIVDHDGRYVHAALWESTPESFFDLHDLLPAGYLSSYAYGIDRSGGITTIAGEVYPTNGLPYYAVIWTYASPVPEIMIGTPTPLDTFGTTDHLFSMAGVANPSAGETIVDISWANDRGGSGICTGTETWSAGGIALQPGVNIITVTVTDTSGQQATDSITVDYDAPDVGGEVDLQNYSVDTSGLSVNMELRKQGGPTTSTNAVLGTGGTYCIEAAPGTYDIAFKGSHWLREVVPGVVVTGDMTGVDASLVNGDCNNDNMISAADLIIVRKAYGTTPGSPKWDERADLNGDGMVSAADLIIVRKNYGKVGDS